MLNDIRAGVNADTSSSSTHISQAAYVPLPTPSLSSHAIHLNAPHSGKGKNRAAPEPDLYTNQYDPIGLDLLHPRPPPGPTPNDVASFPLPYPPQSKISDLESMFNRNNEMSASLPIIPGDDGGGYGYEPGPIGAGLQYATSSAAVSSLPEMGSMTATGHWDIRSPVYSPDLGLPNSLPAVGPSTFPQSPYPYGVTGRLSASSPSTRPSNLYVNPWQLNNGVAHDRNNIDTTSPILQFPTVPPYNSFGISARDAFLHHAASVDNLRSTSSASVERDSVGDLSPDDGPAEPRLLAEDMADEDELAELREIEQGGASRRAERRRMRNKLAQRAFRARSKVSRKDVASRLVEAEASASTQNQELDLLRTMVHTLQNENIQLRRQIRDSNAQRGTSNRAPGGQGGGAVKMNKVDGDPRSRKRSRETV